MEAKQPEQYFFSDNNAIQKKKKKKKRLPVKPYNITKIKARNFWTNTWHIPCSLIFKLKDSKDSTDLNYVCNNKCIHNLRGRVNKNYFLSYTTCIFLTLTKISEWLHALFKTVPAQPRLF